MRQNRNQVGGRDIFFKCLVQGRVCLEVEISDIVIAVFAEFKYGICFADLTGTLYQ